MNESIFEKIDKYYNKEMSPENLKDFEREFAKNKRLAAKVELYRFIENEGRNIEKNRIEEAALKDTLKKLNEKYFNTETRQKAKIIPLIQRVPLKFIASIAAAVNIAILNYFIFFAQTSTQQLASNYIKQNYSVLSQEMGLATNFLTEGKVAYNNKNYIYSVKLFKRHLENHPESSEAIECMGLAYLRMQQFDSASKQFDHLSKMKLQSNKGTFWKGVGSYLKGDKEQGNLFFRDVVKNKKDGSVQAKKWLKKF